MKDFIKGIREHAIANYKHGGWDYVVECYTDEDIAMTIEGAATFLEALDMIGGVVDMLNERRIEVRAEIL